MRSARAAILVALASFAASSASCSGDDKGTSFPRRDCSQVIWVQASESSQVLLRGSWSDWKFFADVPYAGQGWHKSVLDLPPGEYGYTVTVDGEERTDPRNALTTFRDNDEEVSLLLVQDCSVPAVRVDDVQSNADGEVTIGATFLASREGPALAPASVQAETLAGVRLVVRGVDWQTGAVKLAASGLPRGKHVVVLKASDESARAAEPVRAVAWVKPVARSWGDGLLYQIMLDRFRGDGGSILSAPATAGARAGGTLDGIRAEIVKGTFDELGVGTLWLSPVYLNPNEAREGRDGHLYEGYHGYWPLDDRKVDPRIGGEAALDALVQTAHEHGIRLLLDLVPNHVYEDNPRWLDNQDKGWFHEGDEHCVCGDPPCPWSTHIESCWFTSYLPDYRFQNPEVMQLAVDDAIWWQDRFDTDGVRIDAVPMMPRATTRRIAHGIRNRWVPREQSLILGEVFTGPGEWGIASIRYFMGPDTLDSAFDFPLMWAMRDAIASNVSGFDTIDEVLGKTEVELEGSGAVLARIIGNHDTTRFVSVAQGDANGDPWSSPPVQPTDATPYDKQALAMTLMLTLPGMPVVYYGDELGLAGGSDPDCRRIMPSLEGLPPARARLLDLTRKLGKFRACSKALREGTRTALKAERDIYAFLRDAGDGWPVLVLLSKASASVDVKLPGNSLGGGVYKEVVTGEQLTPDNQGGQWSVRVEPMTARVLVPSGNPCSP